MPGVSEHREAGLGVGGLHGHTASPQQRRDSARTQVFGSLDGDVFPSFAPLSFSLWSWGMTDIGQDMLLVFVDPLDPNDWDRQMHV